MRRRQTRPNIFRNLKRFGVFQSDWKYILIPTAVMYFLPFIFGAWFYYIPLGFPLGVLTFIILLGIFNFLRASKPECWLKNRLDAATDGWTNFRAPINDEFAKKDWIKAEKYCRQTANKVFQAFEANFPKELQLRELFAQELFDEMFLSHRREHTEAPKLPNQKRIDVRRYLTSVGFECDETNYIRHNGALVSLVSLKTLPNGFVTADTMRYLTATRNLRFPHEIIVDLTTVEKTSAKKDLQKRIDRIDGSRNTWFGFRQLKKDAVVIKADLENLLEQVEADNEEICQNRLNVIVYGGKPSTKGELVEQMMEFGEEIRKTNEMMTGITKASDEFMQELEKYDVWREEIYDNQLP